MFNDFFDQEKLKLHIREVTSMLRQDALGDDELNKMIEVTKFGCMLDLIDLTQESTEKKLQMKEFKVPIPEIISIVSNEIDRDAREDVYHANFLRALEFIVTKSKANVSPDEIAAAEGYIGNITKQNLRPDDFEKRMAQAAVAQPTASTAIQAPAPVAPPAPAQPAPVAAAPAAVPQPIPAQPVAPAPVVPAPQPVVAPVSAEPQTLPPQPVPQPPTAVPQVAAAAPADPFAQQPVQPEPTPELPQLPVT